MVERKRIAEITFLPLKACKPVNIFWEAGDAGFVLLMRELRSLLINWKDKLLFLMMILETWS